MSRMMARAALRGEKAAGREVVVGIDVHRRRHAAPRLAPLPIRYRSPAQMLRRPRRQLRGRGRGAGRALIHREKNGRIFPDSSSLAAPCAVAAASPSPPSSLAVPPPLLLPAGAALSVAPEQGPCMAIVHETRDVIGKHILDELRRRVKTQWYDKPVGFRLKLELGMCVKSLHDLLFKTLVPKKCGYRTRPTGRRFVYQFDTRSALEQFLACAELSIRFNVSRADFVLRLADQWPSATKGFTVWSPLKLIWHEKTERLTFDGYLVLTDGDGSPHKHQLQHATAEEQEVAAAGGSFRIRLR